VSPAGALAILLAVVLFLLIRPLFLGEGFTVVDEVIDEGDALLIRNNGLEDRVPFSSIVAVLDANLGKVQEVVLRIDPPCRFGSEIAFVPKCRWSWSILSPIADELRDRINTVKAQGVSSEKA
jgi:hypothetical protein